MEKLSMLLDVVHRVTVQWDFMTLFHKALSFSQVPGDR